MKRVLLSLVVLAGCDVPVVAPVGVPPVAPVEPVTPVVPEGSRVTAPPPPPGARTVAQLDTTTAAERAAARAPVPKAAERLGTTVAALGDPTSPGIWIKTPLVTSIQQGRAEAPGGKSITVELRPLAGAAGAGSQISLPAMRLLGLGLTDLPELVLFRLP